MINDINRDWLIEFFKNTYKDVPCTVAEIGVWQGQFSERILKETNVKELHLVDPWLYDLPDLNIPKEFYIADRKIVKCQWDMDKIYQEVQNKFKNDSRVIIHRDVSWNIGCSKQDEPSFDWVYIDGAHDFISVMNDLTIWSKNIKPGGFIALDDYDWGDEHGSPVKSAIDKFLKNGDPDVTRLVKIKNGQCLIKINE